MDHVRFQIKLIFQLTCFNLFAAIRVITDLTAISFRRVYFTCIATQFAYGKLGRLLLTGERYTAGVEFDPTTNSFNKVNAPPVTKITPRFDRNDLYGNISDVFAVQFEVIRRYEYLNNLYCHAYNLDDHIGVRKELLNGTSHEVNLVNMQ